MRQVKDAHYCTDRTSPTPEGLWFTRGSGCHAFPVETAFWAIICPQCVLGSSLNGSPGPQIIMGEDGDIPGRLVDWLIGYQTNIRRQPENLLSSIYEVQLQGV